MRTTVTLSPDAKATLESLERLPRTMAIAIADAMDKENQFTISHIVKAYLSFPRTEAPSPIGLRVQSGLGRRSIRASKATVTGDQVSSTIGSNVAYMAAHEFGATIPPHTITARNAKALVFQIGERTIFRKSVKHPGSVIPARAPVQSGISDRLDNYSQAISAAIAKEWMS